MSAVPAERSREPGGVEVAAAYAHCARVARTHYENFTIGSWLLPRRLRQDLAAVYAFARGADDIADEGEATGRLERLQAWEAKLLACARDPGAAGDPVFLALGHTIAARALPLEPFRDLLEAFRRDAAGETRRFATFADLLGYCRCSANPVGRLVLALFGHRDAARQSRADDICTALQLTNFWQDVAGDLDRGRVYLPEEDLARCPGSHEALATRRVNAGFRDLLAFEVPRTRALFERGLPLADMVGRRLRHEVRIFARGGLAILARIEAAGYDVFARRPTLGRGDLLRLVVRGLWR
ncbi:MAG: squalene synthase HpnC [Deltaproteobacteria bacterium]|nr:MAG: squalene synthase HpnC [Deltaproteobacteria bacterium]